MWQVYTRPTSASDFLKKFFEFSGKTIYEFSKPQRKIPNKVKNINLDKFNDIKIAELFRKSLKPILVFKN
jgi:hypothetical protein